MKEMTRNTIRRWVWVLVLLLAASLAGAEEARVTASLVPSGTRYRPGQPLRVAFVMDVKEGWHTYWLNPGTAGEPARVEWSLPAGWKAMGLEFPVPHRIQEGGLVSFGYEGRVALLDTLVPPVDAKPGRVVLKAHLAWLVCKDICLPEEIELKLVLYPAAQRFTTTSAEFLEWESKLPKGEVTVGVSMRKRWFGGWTLQVPVPRYAGRSLNAEFHPLNREGLDISKPIRAVSRSGVWTFRLREDPSVPFKDTKVTGIVVPPAPDASFHVSAPILKK